MILCMSVSKLCHNMLQRHMVVIQVTWKLTLILLNPKMHCAYSEYFLFGTCLMIKVSVLTLLLYSNVKSFKIITITHTELFGDKVFSILLYPLKNSLLVCTILPCCLLYIFCHDSLPCYWSPFFFFFFLYFLLSHFHFMWVI